MEYIANLNDGIIYTLEECQRIYNQLVACGDISILDYPTFDDYIECVAGMGSECYIVKPYNDIGFKGFTLYSNGYKFFATATRCNEIVADADSLNELFSELSDIIENDLK